jgi:hypothetical protein
MNVRNVQETFTQRLNLPGVNVYVRRKQISNLWLVVGSIFLGLGLFWSVFICIGISQEFTKSNSNTVIRIIFLVVLGCFISCPVTYMGFIVIKQSFKARKNYMVDIDNYILQLRSGVLLPIGECQEFCVNRVVALNHQAGENVKSFV